MSGTFHMTFTGVHGGPCPACGRDGELVANHGAYGPGGQRTLVHRDDDGEHTCIMPNSGGILRTGPEPRWWFCPDDTETTP